MAFPSPAVFAKYEKTEMVKALTDYGTGLEVSGNKPDLINRYNAWYRENAVSNRVSTRYYVED